MPDNEDVWANVPGAAEEDKLNEAAAADEAIHARMLHREAQEGVRKHEARELTKRLIAEQAALERGPLSSRVITRRSVRDLDLPKHLMRDVLYTGAVAVVLGDSQVGKSWVTQGIGCCGAAGLNWPSMTPNTKGVLPVLYIAAEDGGSIEWRVRHWENAHGRNLDDSPFNALVEPINLLDDVVIDELCTLVREQGIRIVVADTVSATFGGEEESNPEFARLVRNCRRITAAMVEHGGGVVILNHHFGKDKEKGGRGGSSLFNDCDIVWELTGTIDDITMTNKKWKVDEKRKTIKLRLDKADRYGVHLAVQDHVQSHNIDAPPSATTLMELEIVRACTVLGEMNQGFGPTTDAIRGLIRERGGTVRGQELSDQLAIMSADGRLILHNGSRGAKQYRLPSVQEQLHDGG